MAMTEGNLEAPTRHPLDWQNPEFYDQTKIDAELERVFDVCHGCRRCVNLCGSFPTLFDLIDGTPDGELEQVNKADYQTVVDQCYLCDVCYMTKCPYVPPHPWNIDFPHLMLRQKAKNFQDDKATVRDKVLSATDKMGFFAGIPIVTQAVNAVNKTGLARLMLEGALGVHKDAWLPEYATKTFPQLAAKSSTFPVIDGKKTPGKVAIFATCYINYNEPGIGQDLIKILQHNEIPYELVEKEACCGMPKLELGDLESVAANKEKNMPKLAELARAGYAILTPIPSCTLMFKQELPLMFPGDTAVQAVKEAMWDPFEYLVARHKDGLLKTNFTTELGHVSYHLACHSRVQNVGQKTAEALRLIPGTVVNVVERCSGHSGTWGVKKEFHEMAKKIGKPVFKRMAEEEPNFISSDCQLAGHHIEQGMAELGLPPTPMAHPLTLMAKGYGL
ncbi:Fe-S oxidoreductase [Polynucleobacter sp. IMCC30063]|uniref:heterodisulfide reductase-related iron-sulfur binding cluster n=1 Tax=unclassified Polynucleobacter TaxID=2640945 RepID=UPI001F3DD7E6|nr:MULTISPECIES: heterodisulfide reductase-related iron-sulfur binding cluster [unclassified Polynucleobacter]MCE7506813.1 Fe-S oxidoreductase [Polynucleobacter sp. IMCC30063]MCE7528110.1 Fe-S oxidoreductase [Polynucleobacter sp. IMCC 30228]